MVLSGGGCRGFAHLGAIKALAESGIEPAQISGTSAGAIAGVFLANGFNPEEIKELFLSKLKLSMLAWNGFRLGLASLKNIRDFLEKNLRYTRFEDLPIPLYVTATDFVDGRQKIFSQGEYLDIILASCSIPALFPPVFIEGTPYVDGGLSNNLPIEPFNHKREEVITIYVNPIRPFNPKESMAEVMDRAIHLSFREMVSRSSAHCYLHLEPANLSKFGLFDLHKASDIFDIGYLYTQNKLNTTQQKTSLQ